MVELAPEVFVLRWGHRPRDFRVTAHVALTARALGAKGFILSDVEDSALVSTIARVVDNWGGRFFVEFGKSWKAIVQEWKKTGGTVVHLTMYGQNIETSNVLEEIRSSSQKILVLVGSQKVPPEFYSEDFSDFNVAVGNQPHSEVAALAVFLDRLYQGRSLSRIFENGKVNLVPSPRGKCMIEDHRTNKRNLDRVFDTRMK